MKKYLPKKTSCCIGFFLGFSLLQLNAFAQKRPTLSSDSLFAKIADTTIRPFTDSTPYYIAAWKDAPPKNVKVIRHFDERTAIIQVGTESELNWLKRRSNIAPAVHNWKFSPVAEERMEKFGASRQTYILTGL